ncbi:hypothetical protein CONPUDRAFT_70275 [Coniophora puteana RWD-64-598 SS2]|uniref:Uncharacterized protein n=1 Tax=Coniophora puteana (strain RWD-64-598) TaxID=741705 RepID=A0A5M3N274_CONPW|nr:uncharacterized protein CONPUDRAFT_70275 [Coniophora puteana RWD-64-598 SS2]EIW85479.1 hypothetical protein CONPUDRAFT_70275 [Coniophora puteana RWD-64-598 SS2]
MTCSPRFHVIISGAIGPVPIGQVFSTSLCRRLSPVQSKTWPEMSAFPRASITTLPTETLLMIFDLVCEGWDGTDIDFPEEHPWPFPLDYACICRKFLDVMIQVPNYFQSMTFHLNTLNFYPKIALEKFFAAAASRSSPFSVAVVSYETVSLESEHKLLQKVMACLQPHIVRCVQLHLNVRFRSSIVNASEYLDGLSSECFGDLTFQSAITDSTASLKISSIKCPALEYLEIDAKSFVDISDKLVFWPSGNESGRSMTYLTLDLKPYNPCGDSSAPLSTREFLKAVNIFDSRTRYLLMIDDVAFDDPLESESADFALRNMVNFEFQGLHGNFLHEIFRNVDPRKPINLVRLVRCTPTKATLIRSANLSLQRFDDNADLRLLLHSWQGVDLHIRDCPSFDDFLLGAMSYGGPAGNQYMCPNLTHLQIDEQEGYISSDALRRMVEHRMEQCPMNDLKVTFQLPMTPQDLMWFQANDFMSSYIGEASLLANCRRRFSLSSHCDLLNHYWGELAQVDQRKKSTPVSFNNLDVRDVVVLRVDEFVAESRVASAPVWLCNASAALAIRQAPTNTDSTGLAQQSALIGYIGRKWWEKVQESAPS